MSFIPLANPLPTTTTQASDVIDAANSSTATLGIGGIFTGTWVDTLNYAQISLTIFTDQNGATNALQVQFSPDNTPHIDHTHVYTVVANKARHIDIPTHARYYRVVYTNGAIAQGTFRLQTILRPVAATSTIMEADDIAATNDSCLLTKSIITGQVIGGTDYVNAKMSADGGLVVNQNIQVDPLNSSTTNIAVGVPSAFVGAAVSNIFATAIQVMLKADQNCTVYIDQGPDNTHFDVSDAYNFYAATGNFAVTVNAVGAYYRVRVVNVGQATTTVFRLQTIDVPILSALPRSLSPDGYLQVAVGATSDHNGFTPYYTPNGEQVSVPLYRLIGSVFPDSILDTDSWTATPGTGGTVASTNGLMTLSTGTTANNTTSLASTRVARYTVGQPNTFRSVIQLPDTGTVNNVRRGGMFTATDGVFYELSGTTFRLVTRKNSVDTAIVNGSFNGQLGGFIPIDTNSHTWEITVTSNKVYFIFDGHVIHTAIFHTTSFSSVLDLPIRFENNNTGGSTTNVLMNVFAAGVSKAGIPQTQPVGRNIAGAQTVTLKIGAGNLHAVTVNANTGTSITLYDNTTGTGTIIATITPNQLATLDFKGILFSTGLTVVTVGASTNCTVMYE